MSYLLRIVPASIVLTPSRSIIRTQVKLTEYLFRMQDIDKCERVGFFYLPRNFLHFISSDNRIHQIAFRSLIAALAFEDRRIVVRYFVNRPVYVGGTVRNDKERRLLITLVYGIEQLRRGKLEKDRIECALPSEDRSGNQEDHGIKDEHIVPRVSAVFFGNENRDDFGTAARRAGAKAQVSAKRRNDTAENG